VIDLGHLAADVAWAIGREVLKRRRLLQSMSARQPFHTVPGRVYKLHLAGKAVHEEL
jgi:hypothetical protein